MRVVAKLCLLCALALPGATLAQPTTAASSAASASAEATVSARDARWSADLAAFDAADQAQPQPPGGVLFVGSSSIRPAGTGSSSSSRRNCRP